MMSETPHLPMELTVSANVPESSEAHRQKSYCFPFNSS